MAKISIPPIPDGYSVQELPQQLYQPLTGGLGAMRLDYIGGAARLATFTWKTDRQGYETVRNFYEENIDQDCPLFQIDLVAHDNALVEYDAYFLPETFTLTGVSGHTYTCQAQAELQPETGESTSWPGTSFVLTLLPDESNYAVKNAEDVAGSRLNGPVGKYRRDQLNNARTASCTWLCDATEYDYLQQCYRAWVAAGGRPFQMQLIMDDATPTTHRATFVPGTFGLASQGGTDSFAVNAQLEVEPTPRSEDEYVLQVDPVPPTLGGPEFPPEAIAGFTYRPVFSSMIYASEYIAAGFPNAEDIGGTLDPATAGAAVDLDAANGNLNPFFSGIATVLSTATVLDGSKRQILEVEINLLDAGINVAFGAWKQAGGPAYDAEAGFGGSDPDSLTNGAWLRSDGICVDGPFSGGGPPFSIGFTLSEGDVIGIVDNFGEVQIFVNGVGINSVTYLGNVACKLMLTCYDATP